MARGLGDGLLRLCNGAWRDNDGDAVDIVEVVRCKDCKYWECGKSYEPYCNRWGNMMTDTERDDFCSYGER